MSRENPNLAPDILGCLLYLLTNARRVINVRSCPTVYSFEFGLDAFGFPEGIDSFTEQASRCDFPYTLETALVGEYFVVVDIIAVFKHAYDFSLSKRNFKYLRKLKEHYESSQSSS